MPAARGTGDRRLWTGDGRAAAGSARPGTAAAAGAGGAGPAAGWRCVSPAAASALAPLALQPAVRQPRGPGRPRRRPRASRGTGRSCAPALRTGGPCRPGPRRRSWSVLIRCGGHPGPPHRRRHGALRGRPPRPAAAAGTAGRWCRRAPARRSRRPRQDQPEVGQVELHRVDDADRDHLVPVAQPGQRRLPVDVADEVGDDEDQAAPAGGGRGQPQHGVEVGGVAVRAARPSGLVSSWVRRRTWVRPVRAGITRWSRLSYRIAPDPVAALREQPGQADGELGEHRVLAVLGRRRSASTPTGRAPARR